MHPTTADSPSHAEGTRVIDKVNDVDRARRSYVRNAALNHHIASTLRKLPASKVLPESLALSQVLSLTTSDSNEDESCAPGGLTRGDLTTLAPVPRPPTPSPRFWQQLESELRNTLLSISDYWHAEDVSETEEEKLVQALALPERIKERKLAIEQQDRSLTECRKRVLLLIEQVDHIQPTLETKLVDALTTHPPQLRAARSAHADVVSATIESALLKLSLVRARAHKALYGHVLPSRPAGTLSRAISLAHEKMQEKQTALEAESKKLDRQIKEYESMLRLVDGTDGSFAQVVKDTARVKKETEECRKDLRRLGWTEDA